jgi:hypothetical protein
MKGQLRRLYWALLALLSLLLGYEALTSQVYGDNSFWLAMVFFGIAVLSLVRLVSAT